MEPVVESLADVVGSFWPKRPVAPLPGARTYIVMGYAHGGTTMIAGLLRMAGLPMGTQIDTVTSEDLEFRQYEPAALRTLIERRNCEHEVWGWKAPGSIKYLPALLPVLRAPHFIMIMRGPLAATRREVAESGIDDMTALEGWMESMQSQLAFLRATGSPTLLISYEKATRRPDRLVEMLETFLGGDWSPEQRARLAQFVNPRRGYQTVNRQLGIGVRPLPQGLAHPTVLAGGPPERTLLWRPIPWERPEEIEWNGLGAWEILGNDARCFVPEAEIIHLNGSLWFQLRIELAPGARIRPRFYCDIGDGFNEHHVIDLGELSSGHWSFRLHLPPPLCGLRFDPHDAAGVIASLELWTAPVALDLRPPFRVSSQLTQPDVIAGSPTVVPGTWRELRTESPSGMIRLDSGTWQLTDADPYLYIQSDELPFLIGSHWLQLELALPPDRTIRPRFYFDIGNGLIEEHTINLPELGTGTWSFAVEFPHMLAALRFDPHDGPGDLTQMTLRTTAPRPQGL